MPERAQRVVGSLAEGWIIFGNRPSAFWHFRTESGSVHCDAARGPITNVLRWEGIDGKLRGKNEVCPACRRWVTKLQHDRAHPKPIPEHIATVEAEPELITIEPLTESQMPKSEAVLTIVEKSKPAGSAASFMALAQFAKVNHFDTQKLSKHIKAKHPDTPRLGEGARASFLIDRELQAKLVQEYPSLLKSATHRESAMTSNDDRLARIEEDVRAVRTLVEAIVAELGVKRA